MRSPRLAPVAAVAITSVLTMALASACGSSSKSTASAAGKLEKTSLVVGEVPSEGNAALYVALQRGLFAAHGLRVTLQNIQSTATIIPDLLHGSIDIAAGQLTAFIGSQAEGIGKFRVLASGLEARFAGPGPAPAPAPARVPRQAALTNG
jgi:NitT/TauT family transport system substrate-binding protein